MRHLLDLLTTILELVGAVAFVAGVGLVFGLGWALIFAGPLLVGLGWLLAPDPAGGT
jgi:hypothetical protein